MKKFIALTVFGWLLGIGLLQAQDTSDERHKLMISYTKYRLETHAFDQMPPLYAQWAMQHLLHREDSTTSCLTLEQAQQLSERMANKYVTEQYPEAMAEFMESYTQDIPLDELRTYMAFLEKKEIKEAETKLQVAYSKQEEQAKLWGSQVARGQMPEPLEEKPCSPSYKTLFNAYYDQTGMDNTMEQTFTNILAGQSTPEDRSTLIGALCKNLRTFMLNKTIESLSEHELEQYAEVTKQPAFHKFMEVMPKIMENIVGFSQQLYESYIKWLEAQLSEQP